MAMDAKRRSRRNMSDAKRKAAGQASTATRAKVSLDLLPNQGNLGGSSKGENQTPMVSNVNQTLLTFHEILIG